MPDNTAPKRLEVSFKGGLSHKYGSADEEDRKVLQNHFEAMLGRLGYSWEPKDLRVTLVEYD